MSFYSAEHGVGEACERFWVTAAGIARGFDSSGCFNLLPLLARQLGLVVTPSGSS